MKRLPVLILVISIALIFSGAGEVFGGNAGRDDEYGWDLLNAYAALEYGAVKMHNVAVTGMSSSPASAASPGDRVEVTVTVANTGDYTETTTVSLTDSDSTDEANIGTPRPLTLAARHSSDLVFQWDTSGASIGDHDLVAQASMVDGETYTSDNERITSVTIMDASVQTKMHVKSIVMNLSGKKMYQATADVNVVDENGSPVPGTTVSGQWTLNDETSLNIDSNVTGSSGTAVLSSKRYKAVPGDKFTVTIRDISKPGYVYDPSNTITSNLVIVP